MSDRAASSISVFGLGYVGCVSAVCLASLGHRVVGVDVNPNKMDILRRGISPVVEERIGDLTAEVVASGDLSVTSDPVVAVSNTDLSLVCVGTPSAHGGGLSTTYLEQVSDEIGAALAVKDGWHVVVYRSTMVAGTCENLLIPRLESASGKRVGVDFGVSVNPEFLREGTSVRDFLEPPKTVVGATDDRSGGMVLGLYVALPGPQFRVPIRVAEMTKYVDNSFHALKVAFANEIGAICSALELDSHEVMEIFLADTKLNISTAYLRPGFAFGGSCLPKDVRALTHTARRNDLDVPLLANLLTANESHMRRAVDLVLAAGRHNVGIFGLSFKPGTDDLRDSPMVELAERLIGKGLHVKIYDKTVVLSRLTGGNRAYIQEQLPHLGDLLTDDADAVLDHGEVLIVGSQEPRVIDAIARAGSDQLIVDLVRLPNAGHLRGTPNYQGIGW
ncbi:nucleotide sugar dehydrogenase [Mycolicibacterium fluoranthenivorans]|uniref:UDP-glucose 6-dehydrogenase n=1 Tax=Mycolicibacterium fluoranthenivorans TaxID=258505 RepID=A0A1G4VJW2_9MYCO|nr:nucleotide sugar dehydrogenase [Mycolicibacterium fluoranthenivorans]SCX07138.1 GDP-mannose 6-dehydrogenase [Mycolicibacterium fluoranthenivorans]